MHQSPPLIEYNKILYGSSCLMKKNMFYFRNFHIHIEAQYIYIYIKGLINLKKKKHFQQTCIWIKFLQIYSRLSPIDLFIKFQKKRYEITSGGSDVQTSLERQNSLTPNQVIHTKEKITRILFYFLSTFFHQSQNQYFYFCRFVSI